MESLIPITPYALEFLTTDFDSFKKSVGQVKITSNLQTTKIPAVPIPGLCHDLLTKIYNEAVNSNNDFQSTVSGLMFNSWYSQPRSSGWDELAIKESDRPYRYQLIHDPSRSIDKPASILTKNNEITKLTEQLFKDLDIEILSLRIMRLQPHGWIRPHIDRSDVVNGLCYFWIPLHEFQPCLKTFPFGWLQHSFGNMYLFNQNSYVHAAVNQSNQPRYVLIGRFNPDTVPSQLLNQYHNFTAKFLDIWKSTN